MAIVRLQLENINSGLPNSPEDRELLAKFRKCTLWCNKKSLEENNNLKTEDSTFLKEIAFGGDSSSSATQSPDSDKDKGSSTSTPLTKESGDIASDICTSSIRESKKEEINSDTSEYGKLKNKDGSAHTAHTAKRISVHMTRRSTTLNTERRSAEHRFSKPWGAHSTHRSGSTDKCYKPMTPPQKGDSATTGAPS